MSAPQAPFSLRDIESAVEQGREAERERIIAVIRDWYEADADLIEGPGNLIDWIRDGENNGSV